MAYTKNNWTAGDPITQERLDHIEEGILNAHNLATAANQSGTIDALSGRVGSLETSVGLDDTSGLRLKVENLKTYVNQNIGENSPGYKAYVQITGATINNNPQYENLDERFQAIEDNARVESVLRQANSYAIDTAKRANIPDDTLANRFSSIESNVSTIINGYNSLNESLTNAGGYNNQGQSQSLTSRLNAIDGGSTPARTLPNVISEINEAHGSNEKYGNLNNRFNTIETKLDNALESTAYGKTGNNAYTSIDARFEAIEDEIKNAHGNSTLDARFDAIDDSTNNSSIISRVGTLESTTSGLNTNINSATGRITTLENTVGSMDTAYKAADSALDTRLDSIDGGAALDTTNGTLAARVTALESEVDMSSADGERRLDDIEGRLDSLDGNGAEGGVISDINTKIDTIATELGMLDNGTINTTLTRVDIAMGQVAYVQQELNDARIQLGIDEETGNPIRSTLDQRLDLIDDNITNLSTAIDHVQGENDEVPNGLVQRIAAAEGNIGTLQSDLNTASTGIKARLDALDNASTGVIKSLQDADTALDGRLDAIDGGTALDTTNGTLAQRVASLEAEPKSATEIITEDYIEYDNHGIPTIYTSSSVHNNSTLATVSTDKDYLLQKDDKYYYWKYIKTGSNPDTFAWALISGGGGSGSGNTSGFDLTEQEYAALQEHAENTDYYVSKSDGVHHYRYVMMEDAQTQEEVLTEIEIGQFVNLNNIKKYNMMRVDTTRVNTDTNQEEDVTYLNLYEFDYGADNTIIDTDSQTMHLRAQVELPKGGGGASSTSVNSLIRIGGQSVQTIVGGTVLLRVFYSSWDGPQSNDGTYTLKAGATTIYSGTFNSGAKDEEVSTWKDETDGYYQFDVSNYCRVGNTTFTLTVNVNGTNLGKSWTVNVIDLHIESDAPDTMLLEASESYIFPYTPFGALQKTLHVVIDGDTEHAQTVSLIAATSGRANSFTITPDMLTKVDNSVHGAHTIEMYLTANIGNSEQRTDSIIREYIWYDENKDTVILASPYNNQTITASQYSTIEIPYQVYKKDASSIDVYYYLDNSETEFGKVVLEDTNAGTMTYLAETSGSHTITIKVDNATISTALTITALEINVAPVNGAIIDFDPTMLTNSSTNRLPTWTVGNTTYSLTTSNNFNWSEDISGGGYKEDVDGKCFIVKAGSYIDLDYKMFETNVFDSGAEVKIIFKTMAVRNADAVWFNNTGLSNNNKNVGIQLGAHIGWLKTDKASDTSSETADTIYNEWEENTVYNVGTIVRIGKTIYQCIESEGTNVPASLQDDEDAWDEYLKLWLKLGQIDTEVLSTNSYLYLPYSEKDKIELDININKYESGSANNFIMSYEDGVPSKAYAYTYGVSGDGLTHTNGIRIGSQDCDVYIYRLRIYNKALSTSEILQNFIADGRNIDEKVARYNKNCIYWDSSQEKYFTSPSGTAVLDPIKLAEQLPDVKILMLDTPRFTTGKKDFVKNSTLRCIHAKGGKVYASRGDADNWFFQNGFHAGQGTTSDNYGQSSRNVDFLFEVDATHWPTKEKNIKKTHTPSANYVSSVIMGENGTKWDMDTETWVPTSIWDETENKWVPNESILSAEEIQNWTAAAPDKCLDWKGDECKVSLTSTSIPNNYFNLKVNVASSENVNNALFQERYNEFLNRIYPSPAYKYNNKIKNDMEFVPAILFLRENDPTVDGQGNYTTHNEFNDTKWHFYSLGNIGDSKKTDYTRAYNPKDMNEFTVENSDNNTNNGQFQSGVFLSTNRFIVTTPIVAELKEYEEALTTPSLVAGTLDEYTGNFKPTTDTEINNNKTYYYRRHLIETDYNNWNDNIAYESNSIVIKNYKIYQYIGANMDQGTAWDNASWNDITPISNEILYYAQRTNPNPMDYIYPITSSQWNIKLGNNYLNRKRQTLETEKFDGDHSFEFRYACMGDYRDGDLINDTTGFAKAQEKTNHQKVLDFYEWLVTASEEDYEDEAANWFIPQAMEFFYAFTHYYTMMDNRAKNTFWHWGKHYISSNDANGSNYNTAAAAADTAQDAYDEALTNLESVQNEQNPIIAEAEADIAEADAILQEDENNAEALAQKEQATQTKDAATALVTAAQASADNAKSQLMSRILKRDELKFLFDNANCFIIDNVAASINDGRRFDLWAYDMDTAVGIDNNGALVFPYGKEDEDYRVEGEASSGYAFNGAGSIFWRRLKNTFADGIRTVMNDADVNCFNSENLIDQFDKFQNCFPEEIWRLDIERKYIRTFTGKSVDKSITTGKQNPRFLTSMMQGRKKYQRRQWVRDQGVYFNSKYRLTDIIRNENTIEFNIITPTNASSLAVTPNYDLKLTPYQDMYLNVQVGNGNYQEQIRAKAGVEYTMDLAKHTSGTFQETRIYINGFNSISGISNLAPMYPYSFTLSALEHLKVLNLGTDNAGYRNANFTSLPFEETTQLPLLETLNIKNCNSLTGTIKLNTANNIRTIEAVGSGIAGVILPDYTNIQTLHLPSTVSALSLYGARFLTDFYMKNVSGTEDYSSLYTLYLYDSDYSTNVHWIDIALAMLAKESTGTNLQLLRMSAATIGNIETLGPMKEFKEPLEDAGGTLELSGTINVTGTWSTPEKTEYETVWPNLTLDTTNGNYQQKHKVTYRYCYQDDNDLVVIGDTIKILYINHGAPLIDIWQYTDTETQEIVHVLEEIPHVDHTVRSDYQFGTRLYGNYVEFSGWKLQDASQPISTGSVPLITSDTIVETYFVRNTRTYPIKWYLKKNANGTPNEDYLVYTSANPVPYGGGYDQEIPTIQDIHTAGFSTAEVSISGSNATYSIFNGWEKTPVNINPTINDSSYNIFAAWTPSTTVALVDLYQNVDNLTPEQLLVLSALNSTAKDTYTKTKIGTGKEFTYTMGYDNSKGTELIGPNTARPVLRLDIPTTPVMVTSVAPMAEGNDAFTIAMDYCLNPNETYEEGKNAAILASCYAIDSSANTVTGFAVYYNIDTQNPQNNGIRVGFGNMFGSNAQSIPIGNYLTIGQRNILVLRHPAGSDTLYIYSGMATGTSLSTIVYANQIQWNNSTSSAQLNFGQLTNSNSADYAAIKTEVTRAKGTIYWAKYWAEDLGVGESKMIASWPHESMTFKITDLKADPTSGDRAGTNEVAPSISFTTLTTSAHGKVVQDRASTSTGDVTGWGTSVARTICNNRVFYGLPIALQSILCKPRIYYRNLVVGTDASMNTYNLSSNQSIRDYIYLPSAANLTSTSTYIAEETNTNMRPYSWFEDSACIRVYNYDTTVTGSWATASDPNITHYYNLRFANYPIQWSSTNPLRIFKISGTDIPSNTTIYTEINKISGGIKYGDIFISNSDIAYMYISDNDITASGAQNEPNSGIFSTNTGGWIAAGEYWTRSMGYGSSNVKYVYVNQTGSVNLSETRSANQYGLSLNYSFAI